MTLSGTFGSSDMDWIGILVAVLFGAVAALIAQLVVGFKKGRAGVAAAVTAVLFLCFRFAATTYVEPKIRVWELKREIRAMPFYKELAVYDPVTYQQVEALTIEATRGGEVKQKADLKIADQLIVILPRYLPNASDESVIAFARFTVTSMGGLDRSNPDACYSYLYPHKSGEAGSATEYPSPEAGDETLQLLENIILSAVKNPQQTPDGMKSNELLQPILINLGKKYGSDLSILQGRARDSSERKKVCEMVTEMYREILALTPAD